MRFGSNLAHAAIGCATLILAAACPSRAAWQPGGVPVCGSHCGDSPSVAPDGQGGAFVVWRLYVSGTVNDFANYARRLTPSGEFAPGWEDDDLPVSTSPGTRWGIPVPDGLGGIIVAWTDYRNGVPGGTSFDLYAKRVLGDGSAAPGWEKDGMPITRAPGRQYFHRPIGDSWGGVFDTWDDDQSGDIYLQHLTALGVPATGFPTDGLAVCTDPSLQSGANVIQDGAGGVILVWADGRHAVQGNLPPAVYGQRVTADGQILWQTDGVRLTFGRYLRNLAPDGQGGFYVSSAAPYCCDWPDSAYYVQRFTAAGEPAPGWPADGILIRDARDVALGLQMVADGSGGVVLEWEDYRDYWTASDEVYMQRVRGDGTLFPGWPANGTRITSNSASEAMGSGFLAADGLGGAYALWRRVDYYGTSDRVQHVTGTGGIAPGWPADGVPLSDASQFYGEMITPDGLGGAIAVWGQPGPGSVRAQRFVADGPVAVTVSLVSAAATSDDVTLVWSLVGGTDLGARVDRRTGESAWQRLGAVLVDGSERLRYEDREVVPGSRYAYRLAWEESGDERLSAETWVEVPAALTLALEGLRPNPAVGELTVAFTLPSDEPARLELLDVGGRCVLVRELGSLGAGRHVVRLGERGSVAPGVYWLRLVQLHATRLARAAVVR